LCGLNESLFVDTAQAMVKNGLLAAGYNRLNLDDCWSSMERAENGSMQWDPEKFPNGLPWLTKYLKSLGFNAGIYTDAGTKSCGGYPGAYGYGELDAETFASWGFDYVKLDGCNVPTGTGEEYKEVYGKWHDILSAMQHPLVFSESAPAYFAETGNNTDWYSVMDRVPEFGQLARFGRDTLVINSTSYAFESTVTGWESIMFNYGEGLRFARYQKPGYSIDPDFLIVDHPDLSLDEKKSHFAIWPSLSAPLIISAYIPAFTAEEFEYLTNKDIIAIDQDPLALQATLVSQDGTWDVLTKNLANGDRLLTVINRGNYTASYSISFARIGFALVSFIKVKDLWTGGTGYAATLVNAVNVPSHGTAIFRISSAGAPFDITPTGMIINTAGATYVTCLTSSLHGLSWTNGTGVDGQVWQTRNDGTIRTISNQLECLTDLGGGKVGLTLCLGKQDQQWDYQYSGTVVNRASKLCLTQGEDESVTTSQCLYEADSQVFGLPSGVDIVQS
jgi:alpha-galactosidase